VMARPLPSPKEVAPVPVTPAPPPVARPPEVRVPTATAVARPVSGPTAAAADDLFRVALQTAAPSAREEHPWLPKLRAVVRFGFLVAKADGRVAQAEKKVLRQYLGEKFGHDGALLRQIDPLMEAAEKAALDEPAMLADVRSVTTAAEQRDLYSLAERITAASGERKALERIAQAFELKTPPPAPPRFAEGGKTVAPLPPPLPSGEGAGGRGSSPDPRAVLEFEPAAALSPDLIRRRYTLLNEKLDPARAAALGPEFAAMADRKRAGLRRAAEALIAPFGVPLDPPAAPPPPADLRHNPDLDDVFGG
jgi:DnaJ-domain-containing protein 1